MNTAHTHFNTSDLAGCSEQAHGLQEVSNQATSPPKVGNKLFSTPPVNNATCFHSQTIQACYGEPGGPKTCHSLIPHCHFNPWDGWVLVWFGVGLVC